MIGYWVWTVAGGGLAVTAQWGTEVPAIVPGGDAANAQFIRARNPREARRQYRRDHQPIEAQEP